MGRIHTRLLLAMLGAGHLGWIVLGTALTAQSLPADTWQREIVLNNRRDHAMAYHTATAEVVLFGGSDRNRALGDTWVWNGHDWYPRRPAITPPARFDHALAYDAGRKVTVLFGGTDGTGLFNDTWEWNGRGWTQVATSAAPSARAGHVMTYDTRTKRVILFGGDGDHTDTWAYDGSTWSLLKPAVSPPVLRDPAMAFDAARGEIVLFGGRRADEKYGQSTWLFDGAVWKEIAPATLPLCPPGRRGHTLAYSATLGRVVLFGGYCYQDSTDIWWNDLWVWDGVSWTVVSPFDPHQGPAPRYRHATAFDERHHQLVVFGGSRQNDNVVLLSDTWVHGFNDAGWIAAGGQSPTARLDHALSYDTRRRQTVLFGGDDGEAPYRAFRDDTWIWSGAQWRELAPARHPSGRRDHRLAYDTGQAEHLLFGGDDGLQRLNDTWTFDGAGWTCEQPAVSPPARSRHDLAHQMVKGRTLLFGGFDGLMKLGDTWEWDGKTWTELTVKTAPPRRSRHAMAYDVGRRRVVLFGGEGAGQVFLNDTWEWDGEGWSQATPNEAPPARSGHTLTYDYLRQRVVLFGGQDENGRRADTWAFDGKSWVRLDPEWAPPVRTRHAAAYDASRQRVVAFGGLGAVKPVSDTWCFLPIRLRVARTDVGPGEAIEFTLDLPDQKGRYYLCALAFHRAPGVPVPANVGQVVLPLLPDALTVASLKLSGFWGKLDDQGHASFSIKVRNDKRLAGVKFFASGLTFDDLNRIHAVTNEVGVVIVE